MMHRVSPYDIALQQMNDLVTMQQNRERERELAVIRMTTLAHGISKELAKLNVDITNIPYVELQESLYRIGVRLNPAINEQLNRATQLLLDNELGNTDLSLGMMREMLTIATKEQIEAHKHLQKYVLKNTQLAPKEMDTEQRDRGPERYDNGPSRR
ncbi:hypothetical protein ABMX62_20220 [Vibrio vulnificus]|uniref:hypothetical protein n=1 Tax=Vibrio vulnificus TaxID=672 RepID=UPI0040596FF3